MSHLDDDLLAGVAVGEALRPSDAEHLAQCAACQDEVAALAAIAARATALNQPSPLQTPPARVWDAIASDLNVDAAPTSGVKNVTPIGAAKSRQRPARRVAWLVAAVAIVIAGVGVFASLTSWKAPVVVASTALVDLATDADAGTAKVEQRQDGTRVLVVKTDTQEVAGKDLEVWLIDPNITGMVSLGFLTSDVGEFTIPAGYAVADYPIVDVSVEPRDGVPTHSGDSVTRGTLSAHE